MTARRTATKLVHVLVVRAGSIRIDRDQTYESARPEGVS